MALSTIIVLIPSLIAVFTMRNEILNDVSLILSSFLPLATQIPQFKAGKHYFVHIWLTRGIMVF